MRNSPVCMPNAERTTMRDRLISFDEALRIIDELVPHLASGAEAVSVNNALGRRLAEDAIAALDVPPFDRAAVDGYALPDVSRNEYRIAGTLAAGSAWDRRLGDDECVKIMTGAPLPEGAAAVAMIEEVTESGGIIAVEPEKLKDKTNFSPRGEDLKAGAAVMKKGAQLGASAIGLLVSCGVGDVKVFPRIRSAIISTGAEIAGNIAQISHGKIMNSNGPMLAALCRENGIEVECEISVGDGAAETESAIEAAIEKSDLVLLSGGVSAGEFDCVPDALTNLGFEIRFRRVAVKPGKPATFATAGNKVAFGLPGNPVAVFLMFHLMALRAAAKMQGAHSRPQIVRTGIGRDLTRASAGRSEFVPAYSGGNGYFYPLEYHGSAHLAAAVSADGFIFIPAGVTHIAAGSDVQVYFFGGGTK